PDAHGLGERGEKKGRDLEIADADPAVRVPVEEGGGLAAALAQLDGAFLPLEVERPDVVRALIQPGEGERQVVAMAEMGPGVVEQGALFQRGNASAQAKG